MVYTEMTLLAMRMAYFAHQNLSDKAGVPYIYHPIHVAEQMDDEISVCVALLHDVVEDTAVTLEHLAKHFPAPVVEAVGLLTHRPEVSYFDYVRAIKANPIAKKVKLADLAHNSDPQRMACCEGLSQERKESLLNRYAKARAILEDDEG